MSSANLGMIIECLVAVLLLTTIGYCVVLNRRLRRLHADEHILKATIGELISATEVAERAILGLKTTTREAELALSQKLRDAQTIRAELNQILETRKPLTHSAVAPPQAAARIEHEPSAQTYTAPVQPTQAAQPAAAPARPSVPPRIAAVYATPVHTPPAIAAAAAAASIAVAIPAASLQHAHEAPPVAKPIEASAKLEMPAASKPAAISPAPMRQAILANDTAAQPRAFPIIPRPIPRSADVAPHHSNPVSSALQGLEKALSEPAAPTAPRVFSARSSFSGSRQ